jgi:serine/threonine protein kinase/formylglycine-generating enzyme required for sulfatase activity
MRDLALKLAFGPMIPDYQSAALQQTRPDTRIDASTTIHATMIGLGGLRRGGRPMSESFQPETNDPRVQAALGDYFDRVDRNEPPDRESFLAQHAEIADELRQFIATEDELRRFAAESLTDISEIPTGSFSRQANETLPPRSPARGAEVKSSVLSGQFGRYRIVRSLGQGAMGSVYLAEDTQLGRQVALKTPQFTDDSEQELLERFYREARAAATLRHPGICPVYDVGDIDGVHYITMAYIEGRPLSDFVAPEMPQTEQQILIAVGKIAQALQQAHDHGIVHRDLKPANVMIDGQGHPVIMDFGLAQQIRTGEDVRLTQTGMILGSPAYMSPEQVEGDPTKVGPAADQYGLGVILYELLTGQVPFVGSLASVMGQILSKEPTPPSRHRAGLDPRVDALCMRMLAKNPADRFSSLSAVAEEIAAIVRNRTMTQTISEPASPPPSKPPAGNSWKWWAMGSVAAAGLLAGAVLYFRVGKTLLEIDIDDPGIQVALRGSTITLTGPANEELKVEPGEHELTITHGDLKFKTGAFTIEKGNKQVVKVAFAGSTLAATVGDKSLPVVSLADSPRPVLLAVPFDSLAAKEAQENWAKYLNAAPKTTNSMGMKLALVPPGGFLMGVAPGRHVRITRPFYLGTCEVTRGQFAQFVAATGLQTVAERTPGGERPDDAPTSKGRVKWEPNQKYTWRAPGFSQEDDHPVVQITWHEAAAFCQWLGDKEGKKYRLPTEAEWEYACRAGTTGRFYNGNDLQTVTQIANVADASAMKVFPHWDDGVKTSDGYVYTSPVGHFRPNDFGLYDMLGNVSEWCSDWQAADFEKGATVDDPAGPPTGTAHVSRGAGFSHAGGCRWRYYGTEQFRRPDWGFRIACDVSESKSESEAAAKPTQP